YTQPNYRSEWETMKTLQAMYENGELNDIQARFPSAHRPAEEFYDLLLDPHETNNLIHSPHREHALALAHHRDLLYRWIIETDDQGRFPESDEALKAVLDRWGDKAVNEEYQRVRPKD
ncbi:MAG: sulfatase, partial [Bacteroidota bacterium]